MKSYRFLTVPCFLIAVVPNLFAADKPKAVEVNALKDSIGITLGQEFAIGFLRDGNQIHQPSKSNAKGPVTVKFEVTTASPIPPPCKGATRPYLAVENTFEKTLHFRVLARLKGSKEFYEITENINPIPAGDTFQKCWGFDDLIEEVVLYEFKLSDKPAK